MSTYKQQFSKKNSASDFLYVYCISDKMHFGGSEGWIHKVKNLTKWVSYVNCSVSNLPQPGSLLVKNLKTVNCRLHFFLMMPTDTNTGVVYALYTKCTVLYIV